MADSIKESLIVAEPASPTRCQIISPGYGQCQYESHPGTSKCPKHSVWDRSRTEKRKVHDYKLQVWQQRLDEFAEGEHVKNLRGEIGILRLTLETIMNRCNDGTELVLYSNRISDLTTKIERLVATCDKLEVNTGMLLDKSAALNLGSKIVEVIGKYVDDPLILDNISGGIIDILSAIGKDDENG